MRKNLTEHIMLKELTIENFTSFDKPTFFSMEASPDSQVSEFEDHIVSVNDNRILKISSIYGPNGGGKSNLLKAIELPSAVVRQDISILGGRRESFIRSGGSNHAKYETFIFNKNKITKESVFYVNEKYEIGYEFEISFSPVRTTQFMVSQETIIIHSERVSFRQIGQKDYSVLFERNEKGEISSDYFGDVDLIKNKIALSDSLSFVLYIIGTFAVKESEKTSLGFDVIYSLYNEVANTIPLVTNADSFYYPSEIQRIIDHKEQILTGLKGAGLSVKDIGTKKMSNGSIEIFLVRSKDDKDNYDLPLSFESSGTQKLFAILVSIVNAPENTIFLGDDFDSFLHPKLIKAILDIFAKPSSHRQFIFNSHDLINMNNENFRRDEIWFAYRNDEYATNIFPLSSVVDYQGKPVRKDAKYSKQYLEDRYGADPFIKKGLSL